MINYWWVTRPKRKLDSVPEVLATFAQTALDQVWAGNKDTHIVLENRLETGKLKRVGERRDHGGSGGRTYAAWLESLGLIFTRRENKQIELTLAGEAIINGSAPVPVITNQILKYQFPSTFSISRNVDVNKRFRVHPFIFMLRLLNDSRIQYLTEEEIAKTVIVNGENDSDRCFEDVVQRILSFRNYGNNSLDENFFEEYKPSRGNVHPDHPFSHLMDIANTLVNWMEYTQLAKRNDSRQLCILEEKTNAVKEIINKKWELIDRPEDKEFYQRKYGLDPSHQKDTRNLAKTKTVTAAMISQQRIIKDYISMSLKQPIAKITPDIIKAISISSGMDQKIVEDTLFRKYPHGSIGAFMTNYFEMAFKGTDEATDFEKATTTIFMDIFGYNAKHLGQTGSKSAPDVLLVSDSEGYQAIIDNKAYSKYSITGDHKNRMVHNYIANISNYSESTYPIAFFSYISGGFINQIDKQIRSIADESGVHGSGLTVSGMINLIDEHQKKAFTHSELAKLFGIDRQILLADIHH